MKIIAGLVALFCSHWGDRCSRRPAHCRGPRQHWFRHISELWRAAEQWDERCGARETHTKPENVTDTFASLTGWNDKKWRGTKMRKSHTGEIRGERTWCRVRSLTSLLFSKKRELREMLRYFSGLTFLFHLSCIFLEFKWCVSYLKDDNAHSNVKYCASTTMSNVSLNE